MPERFTFLPHAQSSLTSLAEAPISGGARLRLPYEVEITRDGVAAGGRIAFASDLIGPGDVQTIDRAVITRVEPKAGLRGFEPNYFPHIEFRDADFPWRYSLDRRAGAQKTPWIALIALEASEFAFIDTARSPLKRIRIADQANALPDPDGLALTAHVQANAPDDAGGDAEDRATAVLEGDADAASRLLCMRRLKPTRTYYTFLVPVYEAGRLTGLGESGAAAPFDRFAWGAGAGPVDLPVYYDWRFTTDEAEDVELLLRRLTALNAKALAERIGDTKVSAVTPGYFDKTYTGEGFERQSAMQVPSDDPPELDTSDALVNDMIPVLNEVIQSAEPEGEDDEDPLVAFPAYGARFGPEKEVKKDRAAQRRWFDMINLDLKFRHAAGLGADIVRRNQEVFSYLAWTQYEDIVAANERLARLQAAQAMAERLVSRHFDKLPSDVALALAPAFLMAAIVMGLFGVLPLITTVIDLTLGTEVVETNKWGGLTITLVVAIFGIVISLPVGILLALGRQSNAPIIKYSSVIFIEVVRGIPLISVLFFASAMLPYFLEPGVDFNKLLRAMVGVVLFASAYMAEVIRGGLQAMPKGQYEGGMSLGLTFWQQMRLIILPQALTTVIPGIVNTFIGLFKDTTLVLIISIFDLLGILSATLKDPEWSTPTTAYTGYLVIALIYWIFCFGMSRYSAYMERKLNRGHR